MPARARRARGGSSWTTFGHDLERTGFDPNETLLDPGAAARLREAWSVPVGGLVDAQPTYAPAVTLADGRKVDLVIVGTEAGRLLALDAAERQHGVVARPRHG